MLYLSSYLPPHLTDLSDLICQFCSYWLQNKKVRQLRTASQELHSLMPATSLTSPFPNVSFSFHPAGRTYDSIKLSSLLSSWTLSMLFVSLPRTSFLSSLPSSHLLLILHFGRSSCKVFMLTSMKYNFFPLTFASHKEFLSFLFFCFVLCCCCCFTKNNAI